MRRLLGAWNRFFFEPVSTSSISMFRIFFGLLSLLNALLYLPDFSVWFSSSGAAPLEAVARYQPGALRGLLLWLDLADQVYLGLIWLQILSSLTVMLGLSTKPSLIVLFISRLILFGRNPALWHQVDILLRVWGTLLLFAPAGEMYSVDSYRRRRRGLQPRRFAPWAQRLVQLQLSLIYAEGFFGKIAGESWRDGSAVYYATHFPDGGRYPIPAFMDHFFVYACLTYFTLAIEFSLTFLTWVPLLCYPVLLVGVFFHLGIHAFINLDLLEFGAMIAYLCFIDPVDMERFVNTLSARFRRASLR